jgi:hypothetical protein
LNLINIYCPGTAEIARCCTELEKLKPEVQKQVAEFNKAFLKSTSASSKSLPSSFSAPYNTPSTYNSLLQLDFGVARPPLSSIQLFSGVSDYEKVCWIQL